MLTVHLDLKLGITFEASTTKFENSFSVLKITMRDRKQSMTHACKAYFAQLAFESDSPKNLKTDWKKTSFDSSLPQIVDYSYFS